ncbi:MAG: hypothetical protein U1A78_35175 [Polyangia bacterium]
MTAPQPAPDPLTAARERLQKTPGDARTLVELAELYFLSRDYLRARQYLALAEQVSARAPGAGAGTEIDREKMFQLGLLIAVHGEQYSVAIKRCQERLMRKPADSRVRSLLASLHEALGDELAAEKQLRLLLLMHPEQSAFLVDLARFYERGSRADKKEQAHRLYHRYLDVAPQGALAPQVRAALLAQQVDESPAPTPAFP